MYIMPTGVSTNSSSGITSELVGECEPLIDGVEKRRMGGIHGVFHDLQPVAWVEVFPPGHEAIAGPDKTVIHREKRLPVGGPIWAKTMPPYSWVG